MLTFTAAQSALVLFTASHFEDGDNSSLKSEAPSDASSWQAAVKTVGFSMEFGSDSKCHRAA